MYEATLVRFCFTEKKPHAVIDCLLACVAADSFPSSGGAEMEQASEKRPAKEHAWGEQKNWGEVGRG